APGDALREGGKAPSLRAPPPPAPRAVRAEGQVIRFPGKKQGVLLFGRTPCFVSAVLALRPEHRQPVAQIDAALVLRPVNGLEEGQGFRNAGKLLLRVSQQP